MRLTSEQRELQALVRRFLSERVSNEYIRSRISSASGYDQALRQAAHELGLYDAFSGAQPICGMVELSLIAAECGHALAPDSPIEDVLVSTLSESLLGSEGGDLFAGPRSPARRKTALVFPRCGDFIASPDLSSVTGTASWAVGAHDALQVVGFTDTQDGCRLFVADLEAEYGGKREVLPSLDLTTPLMKVELASSPCKIFSREATEAIVDAIFIVKAAEVVGLCRRVVHMTTEYTKTRQQFGTPIGAFQAVQQKLAQAYAESEALASLCQFAAWSYHASPHQKRLTSHASILKAAQVGVNVCETAIQCHGGIGFTWEYDLHLYLRRAKTIEAAFGISEDSARSLLATVV